MGRVNGLIDSPAGLPARIAGSWKIYRDVIFGAGQSAGEIKPAWLEFGFKFGDKETHTSRTIMLDELSALLRQCPAGAARAEYVRVLVEEICRTPASLA